MEKIKKSNFKMPHSLVIVAIVVIFAALMTWVIPAGEYARVENAQGIKVIDPNSFELVNNSPVNPLSIPKFSIDGYVKTASLIFVILFSGSAFDVITTSGALQSLISMFAKKYSTKENVFIPILTLIFALICTTQGVNTFIGFAPILVMMAKSFGYDSIVGAGIILLGGAVGFSTGTLNVSTTIIAQKIAELPLYSGIEYRVLSFIVFYIVTNIYLIRYAKKIRLNPKLSPMYDLDMLESNQGNTEDVAGPMTIRKWLVILSLFGVLAIIVYGGVKLDWGLEETAAAFIWMGIIAGIAAGFSFSKIAKCFENGAKRMIGAALIIGLARSVSSVLTAGTIMDTVIHSLALVLGAVPKYLQGTFLYLANIIINMFITSGSGQAAAVIPIITPLADMIGMTRQTSILAFNFGDGFCNYVLPTSTALMGILGTSNIPYDRWMKFMWKLFLIWIVTGSVLMLGAQIINLGPM